MNSPAQTAAERAGHEQVLAWGRGEIRPTPAVTIGELFDAASRAHADLPAVIWRQGTMTYAELRAASGRLALRLQRDGAGPGTTVALSMPRGIGMVVAMLGILRAGAAYVPIDPELPQARRAFLRADSGAALELADDAALAARAGATAEPERLATPADLAYVIYTSGSTGTPKGVAVEHRAVVDFVVHNAAAYGVGPGTRMLALASLSFDVSVAEILTALSSGATLVVADGAQRTSPARLQRTLRDERITVAELPPALLGLLDPTDLPDLRLVSVGGEAPAPSEVRRWVRAGHRVINAYGPTEATVTATLMEADASDRPTIPIGRPMANQRAYVLDDARRLVAPDEDGELWLAGAGLARGYLGRPELTAERFVADPFAAPGERMYRTGDRVRWDAEGHLEFLGRVDEQLNVNGHRVEPGEVEARLSAHPALAAAAVAVHEDRGGRLAAYVVARPGTPVPGAGELEEWCARTLPTALVPRAFTALDALPLTTNGKTDRAALIASAADGAPARAAAAPAAAAETPTEAALLDVWRELLAIDAIGRDDDFFALGGHSLAAMRLLARIRGRFGVELDIADVQGARSAAALAALIDAAPVVASRRAAIAVDASAPSLSQQRLWLADRLGATRGAYNVPIVLRLRGELDRAALARALGDVVARHEELRTSFPPLDGRPKRAIAPAADVALAVDELAGRASAFAEADADALVRDEISRPFDLTTGPLWRARLIALGAAEHILVLVLHHIVCDGWSLSILLDDLSARYAAHVTPGSPAHLAPIPEAPATTYAAHAAAQRSRLTGPPLIDALDFWRGELNGAPPVLELPADRERPPVQTYTAGARHARVPAATADALRAVAAGHGQTLFAALLAGFQSLLGRLCGTDDLVVACPVAGRPDPELEAVVGFFIDMVAVRGTLEGNPTFAELLGRSGARLRRALAHQSVPFDMVVDALRPARDLSRNPLAQVALNFHSYPPERLALPHVAVEEYPVAPPGSLFDLTLHVREDGTALELEAVYRADLYDAERIDELLTQYVHLLAQCATAPERPLHRCSLRAPASRAVLPAPDAALSGAAGSTVTERIAAQAARTPDRIAVQTPGAALTYAELLERSAALGARARAAGQCDGRRVVVHARRTPDLVGEIVGLMSTGAVPVLVDQDLPPARRRALIDSAQPCTTLAAADPGPGSSAPARETRPAGARFPRLDDDAYVLFTSGSTGVPKPVLATHRPLAHFLDWYLDTFAIAAEDRFAALSGVAHDPILRDVLAPLCVGASTHMPAPAIHRAPGALLRWLAEEEITIIHITPQLGRMLAHAAGEAGVANLPALRLVALGGDVLREDDVARWRALAPEATLASFYGATETPQAVGCAILSGDAAPSSDPSAGRRAVPVGHGIDDVQLLVLAADGQPAGVGEVGEIWVRTPHLARGYVNDLALSATRFLLEPGAARRYGTGDLGRYLPDGRIEFLGRRDDQLKIRGFRVEPAEVTAALAGLAGVSQAHVAGVVAADGERGLVACVAGADLDAEQLQLELRAVLPDYMVPERIVVMARLPLTPNGKIDAAALRLPPARPAQDAYRPPSTGTERLVAGIWRDVLGIGVVGRDDNFFDVGGNSLRLAQVQARLSAALAHELAIVDLFRYPTIRTLCAFLERGAQQSHAPRSAPHRASARLEHRARRPHRPRASTNRKERL